MREIKFRAWDLERKKWLYSKPFCSCYFGKLTAVGMCTDLKDSNGSDIYEGDIVQATYYDLTHGIIGVVRFDNGSFYIDCDGLSLYTWFDYEVEVLGNIFENKELLKEKI